MDQRITKEQRNLLDKEAEAGNLTNVKLVEILGESVLDDDKTDHHILKRLIIGTGITDVNRNITTTNFKITQEPDDRELILAYPNKLATTKEVHAFMESEGIQPEGPEYLARYTNEHINAGLEFPIVALDPDKLWLDPSGRLCCVVLWIFDGVRYMGLGWVGGRWLDCCRFVGSRKLKT